MEKNSENEIEQLKLENEKMQLELENKKLKKKKNQKTIILCLIIAIVVMIIIGIIFFAIILRDNSMLLNKTWNGVSEEHEIYDLDGDPITIPSNNSNYIEFYDNHKYVEYVMRIDESEKTAYFLNSTVGTYKVFHHNITLKAEKMTRDGYHFQEVDYKRKLVLNKSKNSFYYYQTANKYLTSLEESEYDPIKESIKEKNDEKVKYKITFKSVLDEYYYDYNNQ